MWVIKLGGSLLGSPELSHWLDLIARFGDGRVVIVPGGGLFADAVRESQIRTGISDVFAHRMAVMAMDQYGVLLTGLNLQLATAASELEIAERGWQHRGIVWLPSKMVCADDAIPTNWQVTSDSLAAWLAAKINAEHLLIVKSSRSETEQRPETDQISTQSLTESGMVDECFGSFIAEQPFKAWILDKQDYAAFNDGFTPDKLEEVALRIK